MIPTYPGPAYRIVTPRLVIRCWQPADIELYETALTESSDHLKTFLPWAAHYPEDPQLGIDRLRRFRGMFDLGQDYVYGIFSADETRVIGGTGLHLRLGPNAREIGYWIHKDMTNLGYATEVSAALTRVAFDVDGVERVEIHCAVENLASAAVPRKLGYTHEATLRMRSRLLDGILHDSMVWVLFRAEYEKSPSAQTQIEAFDAAGRKIL